jgi:uncharacterized protein YyaL (SSP411 family)
MQQNHHTNALIHESSPYLLQHAHNPVDWHPWNEETLEKARRQDKMLLVSIGYSACHWCHVMEHESFEDEQVAAVMNKHFVCVKVDREERPDVDQVYMDAVQLISGRGGWPLNCFAMPDGKPVWGGTYFRKEQWLEILENVALLFDQERQKLERQAAELYTGILEDRFLDPAAESKAAIDKEVPKQMADALMQRIDKVNGGFTGAPKFPMPNNILFLLRYHFYSKDEEALRDVEITLQKMARGGIFDQVGGGFARYSVDGHWHVPHFEKMLYDNAQLVSLYSEAYRLTRNPFYERVIRETLEFIDRELTSPEGGFYSALDADSEGIEGKYYVWTEKEFMDLLGESGEMMKEFFGVGENAYWEDGKNILVQDMTMEELATNYHMTLPEATEKLARVREILRRSREERIRPGLDDKILTSWNALMLKGYVDAYRALEKPQYLESALRNAEFLASKMIGHDGGVMRNFKDGKATITGFLDDHAFLADACSALYEVTFDERWLRLAEQLIDHVVRHFYDPDVGLFYYTSDRHADSIVRKVDVTDNVIPSSLSSLSRVLYCLGLLFEKPSYHSLAEEMIAKVTGNMQRYPSAFTNWGILYLSLAWPFHTMVMTGPKTAGFMKEMRGHYRPDLLLAGNSNPSPLAILKDRVDPEKSRIYVCSGSECSLPVSHPNEALKLMNG